MLIKLDQVFLYILVYKIIYHVINLMILFWHHKYYLHQIAIVTHHGLFTKNSESDCTIDQEASKNEEIQILIMFSFYICSICRVEYNSDYVLVPSRPQFLRIFCGGWYHW